MPSKCGPDTTSLEMTTTKVLPLWPRMYGHASLKNPTNSSRATAPPPPPLPPPGFAAPQQHRTPRRAPFAGGSRRAGRARRHPSSHRRRSFGGGASGGDRRRRGHRNRTLGIGEERGPPLRPLRRVVGGWFWEADWRARSCSCCRPACGGAADWAPPPNLSTSQLELSSEKVLKVD